MARHFFAGASGRIARILITVFIALGCRPAPLLAQVRLPPPGPPSLPPAPTLPAAGSSPTTVLIDQATLEQILTRLESTEAEIRSLRQPVKILTPVTTPCGDITFKPGLRLQQRYSYDDFTDNNDFFVRRFRLKAGGSAFGIAKYYGELKWDSNGKFEVETKGVVENAWLEFTLIPECSYLRVGLYDVPFSRNALTSDSKLLFMDRTLIKSELPSWGWRTTRSGCCSTDDRSKAAWSTR